MTKQTRIDDERVPDGHPIGQTIKATYADTVARIGGVSMGSVVKVLAAQQVLLDYLREVMGIRTPYALLDILDFRNVPTAPAHEAHRVYPTSDLVADIDDAGYPERCECLVHALDKRRRARRGDDT